VSEALVHDLPDTLVALTAGEISYRHAQILVDHTAALDSATRAALEAAALPYARNLTAAKFERKIRTLRERANPESIRERHERAACDREVVFAPARDGMAWLSAYLPAVDALGAFNRISEWASNLQHPTEVRTLTQLCADVFRDLVIDGQVTDGEPGDAQPGDGEPGNALSGNAGRGVTAKVFVTVPVLTLLGREDLPATLDGYGPIDADTARMLAGHAPSFVRCCALGGSGELPGAAGSEELVTGSGCHLPLPRLLPPRFTMRDRSHP
jgi:hypothetical protein